MKNSKIWWLLVFLYMGLIFTVSSIPSDNIPDISIPYSDKIAHLTEYTILGWLLAKACKSTGVKYIKTLSISIGTLYGASDEFHQSFVSGRECDIVDLIFDGIGCSLAQLIQFLTGRLKV